MYQIQSDEVIDYSKYFNIEAYFILSNNVANGTQTYTKLNIALCQLSDFPGMTNDDFISVGLEAYYCIQDFNVTLSGFWDEPSIGYLSLQLFYCQGSNDDLVDNDQNNTTNTNKSCYDIDTINDFLFSSSQYFNILMLNTAINPQNYESPFTKYLIIKYKAIYANKYKSYEIYIKPQQLDSDEGLIFSDHHFNDSITFDSDDFDDASLSENLLLVEFTLNSANNKIIYHRSYMKMPNVLANVGGLSSVFVFVLQIVCQVFTKFKRDEVILNKIFDFDLNYDNVKVEARQNILRSSKKVFNTVISPLRNKIKEEIDKRTDNSKMILDGLKTTNLNQINTTNLTDTWQG